MFGRIGPLPLTEESINSIVPFFCLYIFVFFLYGIFQPLLIGFVLHQVKNFGKKVSMKKSFKFSFSVFLKSFFISLLFLLAYTLLGLIPFVGLILSLLFHLASFYVYPAAIMDGKRVSESFKKSFSIFKKAPLQTFILSLVIASISFVLISISFLPFGLWLGGNLYAFSKETKNTSLLAEYLAKLLLSPTILPFLVIPAFFISFCFVMEISAQARLYVGLKRKA
jgi:hypothetical protein